MKTVNLLILFIILLFSGCAKDHLINYNKDTKTINLTLDTIQKEVKLEQPIYKPDKKQQCLDIGYRITDNSNSEYGYLHFDYISIDNHCWFTDNYNHHFYSRLKKLFKTSDVKYKGLKKVKDLEFLDYQVNGNKVNVIRFYGVNEVGFIVDSKGKLTQEIKQVLK